MREGRPIQVVGCLHRFRAERRRSVPHQGHMITELGTPARGRLDAGVRGHADDDDLLDVALLEVKVEVGIGKAVLAPMRLDRRVARLRCEFRMPLAAPRALREDGASVGQNLQWARMTPSVIIALAPALVRDVEHRNVGAAPRGASVPALREPARQGTPEDERDPTQDARAVWSATARRYPLTDRMSSRPDCLARSEKR